MSRVLVVEDSNVMQVYYTQIFSRMANWQITFVKNGQEALDQIKNKGVPDVVVLDINMPVMDGLEFLGHFRGEHAAPPARVIIVSTEGREDDLKRGLEAGASAYLKKPFKPEALRDLVQSFVSDRPAAEAKT